MESIACPKCSEIFPLYLFEFGIPFRCSCGVILASAEPPTKKRRRRSIRRPALPRQLREELVQEEVKVGQLRRWADRISFLIVASDFAEYEI